MSAAIKRIVFNLPLLKNRVDYSKYVERAMPSTVTRSAWARTGKTLGNAMITVGGKQLGQGEQRRAGKGKAA